MAITINKYYINLNANSYGSRNSVQIDGKEFVFPTYKVSGTSGETSDASYRFISYATGSYKASTTVSISSISSLDLVFAPIGYDNGRYSITSSEYVISPFVNSITTNKLSSKPSLAELEQNRILILHGNRTRNLNLYDNWDSFKNLWKESLRLTSNNTNSSIIESNKYLATSGSFGSTSKYITYNKPSIIVPVEKTSTSTGFTEITSDQFYAYSQGCYFFTPVYGGKLTNANLFVSYSHADKKFNLAITTKDTNVKNYLVTITFADNTYVQGAFPIDEIGTYYRYISLDSDQYTSLKADPKVKVSIQACDYVDTTVTPWVAYGGPTFNTNEGYTENYYSIVDSNGMTKYFGEGTQTVYTPSDISTTTLYIPFLESKLSINKKGLLDITISGDYSDKFTYGYNIILKDSDGDSAKVTLTEYPTEGYKIPNGYTLYRFDLDVYLDGKKRYISHLLYGALSGLTDLTTAYQKLTTPSNLTVTKNSQTNYKFSWDGSYQPITTPIVYQQWYYGNNKEQVNETSLEPNYQLLFNNDDQYDDLTSTTYDVNILDNSSIHSGSNTVKIYSYASDSGAFNSEVYETTFNIDYLDNPVIDIERLTYNSVKLTWTEPVGATKYVLTVDGVPYSTQALTTNEVTLTDLVEKTYAITLTAFNDTYQLYSQEIATGVVIGKPEAIDVTVERSQINQIKASWNSTGIAGTKYFYSFDSETFTETTNIEFYFSDLTIGTHTFKLFTRIPSGTSYIDTETSVNTVNITKLPTPAIVNNTTGFTWDYSDVQTNFYSGFKIYMSYEGSDYSLIGTTTDTYYNLPEFTTEGFRDYKIQAYYNLISPTQQTEYFDSELSNDLDYLIQKLNTPVASWRTVSDKTSSIVDWTGDTNTNIYEIYLDNSLFETTDDLYYEYLKNSIGDNPGSYKIKIKAKKPNNLFIDSEFSNEIVYNVEKLNSPIFDYSNVTKNIFWDKIVGNFYTSTDSSGYYIIVDGEELPDPILGSEIEGDQAYWNIGVLTDLSFNAYAFAEDQIDNPNPYFIDSDIIQTNTIKIGTWIKPTNLRVENGKLVWNPPYVSDEQNPSLYNIYCYGELFGATNKTTYDIPAIEPTTYSFSVKIPAEGYTNESPMSDSIFVNITKLDKPVISVDKEEYEESGITKYKSTLYFSPINGADYYRLFINGVDKCKILTSGVDISQYIPQGSTEISLQACSNDLLIISSDISNIVTKYIPIDYQYSVTINNEFTRQISLPFTITETADETLSNGSLTLQLNDDKEPYETNTDISINIVGTQQDQSQDTYVPIKQWNMIIAADDVDEVYINGVTKYRHNITVVEQTKLLEYEILPDISFTQPQAITVINEYIEPYYPDKWKIPNNGNSYTEKWLSSGFIGGTYYKSNVYTNFDSLTCNITKKIYTSNGRINLPCYVKPRYIISVQEATGYGLGIKGDYKTKVRETIPAVIKYYARDHQDAASTWENDNNGTLIATYNWMAGDDLPTFDINNWTDLKNKSHIDIIMTIDNPSSALSDFSTIYNLDETIKVYVASMVDKIGTYEDGGNNRGMSVSNCHKFKYIWENIEVADSTDTILDDAITVSDALEKIVSSVEPLRYNSRYADKHAAGKYIIDPEVKVRYSKLLCPEVSYTGGKSLFEALQDIGREFLGIPYLSYSSGSNKVINFRIMRNDAFAYEDSGDVVTSSSSSMENNVSGFISNVSNIITSDEEYSVYPSKNGWVTPRSTDPTEATIKTETCGIVLDKPIYKIIKVEISNYNPAIPSSVLDITPYVVEQTIYDTLNSNAYGKGSALCYSKGDNCIYGLGILPQVSEFKAALGLSETNYVINNILARQTADDKYKDLTSIVKDLKFRITYMPYVDTQVKLTQFNISNENILSYKAYNQTNNLVQADKYGSSLSKQIERLGNNDIQKTYLTKSIIHDVIVDENNKAEDIGIPELFQCRKFNDEKYYIDSITTSFNDQYISVSCNYTKNYNKIDDRIGVNAEYRQYEIGLQAKANRVMYFNDYCYLDNKIYKVDKYNNISKDYVHSNYWGLVLDSLFSGGIYSQPKPSSFYCRFKTKENGKIKYKQFGDGEDKSSWTGIIDYALLLPATKLNIRNGILFHGKMYDNFSAGTYVDNTVTSDKITSGFYATRDARYVDTYGKAFKLDISLCNYDLSNLDGKKFPLISINPTGTSLEEYLKSLEASKNTYYSDLASLPDSMFSGSYVCNKDSSEALLFNYQMNFNSLNKDIDIKSGLTRYMFQDDSEVKNIGSPHLYLFKGDVKNSDYLDLTQAIDLGNITWGLATPGDGTEAVRYIASRMVQVNCDINGFCIAYSKTYNSRQNEILIYQYLPKKYNGTPYYYETKPIYFNFLDKAIVNNDLKKSGQN